MSACSGQGALLKDVERLLSSRFVDNEMAVSGMYGSGMARELSVLSELSELMFTETFSLMEEYIQWKPFTVTLPKRWNDLAFLRRL